MAGANESGIDLVQIPEWRSLSWLRHGFSSRAGGVSTAYHQRPVEQESEASDAMAGDLNLGWTKDDNPACVAENRRRLIAAVAGAGDSTPALVTVRQVHSAVSMVVRESANREYGEFVTAEGRALLEADGLMTEARGVLLGIQTADCVPVFVVDTKRRALGNFHAGWRGTAAGIVELGVAKMAAEFGSRPDDMVAAIGPSIGVCCYSVGDEVYEAFTRRFGYGEGLFSRSDDLGALHLDLWKANRRQLLDAGVAAERIATVGECTGCAGLPGRRRYFSHRREQGFTGRMLSVIGIGEG